MDTTKLKSTALPACKEFGVKRLDVFGSVARGTAASNSDVDLLVEFEEPLRAPSKRYFGLLHRLEDELGCSVDLVTITSIRNPYFKRIVLRERIPIYEG
jgi:uncharacterized protein